MRRWGGRVSEREQGVAPCQPFVRLRGFRLVRRPGSRARQLGTALCALWLAGLLGLTHLSMPTSAIAQQPDAPLPLAPLKSVAVPKPKNLGRFVRDGAAAAALGKALFWDMQLGSDAVQSCASCHFSAFADPRSKNQLNPATIAGDSRFDLGGPNYRLSLSDFPLHKLADPDDRSSTVLHDYNDIVSSQGVFLFDFRGTEPGEPLDKGVRLADPVFSIDEVNVRRVEPRRAPTGSTPSSTSVLRGTAGPSTSSTASTPGAIATPAPR